MKKSPTGSAFAISPLKSENATPSNKTTRPPDDVLIPSCYLQSGFKTRPWQKSGARRSEGPPAMFPISFFPQLSSKCHAVDRRGDRRWNNHQLSRHSSQPWRVTRHCFRNVECPAREDFQSSDLTPLLALLRFSSLCWQQKAKAEQTANSRALVHDRHFEKSKFTQQRLKARLVANRIPIRVVLHPLALSKSILDRLIQVIQRLISGTCQSINAPDIIQNA